MDEDYDDIETANDDGVSLPKATVSKLITEMMPADISCAKETRDLLIDCCVEFIHLIASEANEISEKNSKKTISAEHVLSSLEALGFNDYISEVSKAKEDHVTSLKEREKKTSKKNSSDISDEEKARKQMELLEASRRRYEAQAGLTSSVAPEESASSS